VHVSRDSRDEKRGADSERASQPAVLTYFEWVSEILDEHEGGNATRKVHPERATGRPLELLPNRAG
jgi:hypothetical protein